MLVVFSKAQQQTVPLHENKQQRTFLNPPLPWVGPQVTPICYCLAPLQLFKCMPTAEYCKSLINDAPAWDLLHSHLYENLGSMEIWGHLVYMIKWATSFHEKRTRAEVSIHSNVAVQSKVPTLVLSPENNIYPKEEFLPILQGLSYH